MKRLSALAVLLMSSAAPLAVAPVFAAPAFAAVEAATPAAMSPSVYARAEAVLPQHVDELIYGLSVRPQWIGDSQVWFERRTAGAATTCWSIRPRAGPAPCSTTTP